MMNLDSFIKNNLVKESYKTSHVVVSDVDECRKYAALISFGTIENINLIFETTYLKNIFFSHLKTYRPETTIVNCNSSTELMEDSLHNSSKFIVFNNIHLCKEESTKNIKKGIWVC